MENKILKYIIKTDKYGQIPKVIPDDTGHHAGNFGHTEIRHGQYSDLDSQGQRDRATIFDRFSG